VVVLLALVVGLESLDPNSVIIRVMSRIRSDTSRKFSSSMSRMEVVTVARAACRWPSTACRCACRSRRGEDTVEEEVSLELPFLDRFCRDDLLMEVKGVNSVAASLSLVSPR